MAEYDWLLGIALMFGLAISFTFMTEKSLTTFFVFLTIFNAFMYWIVFLPLWSLVLNIIVLTLIGYMETVGGKTI